MLLNIRLAIAIIWAVIAVFELWNNEFERGALCLILAHQMYNPYIELDTSTKKASE